MSDNLFIGLNLKHCLSVEVQFPGNKSRYDRSLGYLSRYLSDIKALVSAFQVYKQLRNQAQVNTICSTLGIPIESLPESRHQQV